MNSDENNYCLGDLLEILDIRGGNIDRNDVQGVTINKEFAPTVANLKDTDLSKYKQVPPRAFASNLMHIGRDIVFPVALNKSSTEKVVSPAYFIFKVKDEEKLLPEFLFILFNTSSFDRRVWFNTDSSIRGNLPWEELSRLRISLPSLEVQKACVEAYEGLTTLISQNEILCKQLDDISQKLVIECKEKWPFSKLLEFISETNVRNTNKILTVDSVRGISINKTFINTKADMTGVSLKPYKIVSNKEFAYVTVTSRNGGKISIAINDSDEDYLCSSSYVSFKVNDWNVLDPEYLYLQFKNSEFDRYARFNSWGSARETFNFDDMCRVEIPVPPIDVQRAIVALHHCAEEARKISLESKSKLNAICPALIRRADCNTY